MHSPEAGQSATVRLLFGSVHEVLTDRLGICRLALRTRTGRLLGGIVVPVSVLQAWRKDPSTWLGMTTWARGTGARTRIGMTTRRTAHPIGRAGILAPHERVAGQTQRSLDTVLLPTLRSGSSHRLGMTVSRRCSFSRSQRCETGKPVGLPASDCLINYTRPYDPRRRKCTRLVRPASWNMGSEPTMRANSPSLPSPCSMIV